MKFASQKLMIPGPVEVADDVLEAMGSPVQAHYGPAWTKFYNETLAQLKQVFGTSGDVFLMVGSGTVGIDACIGSALSTGEKILVGRNGFFGDRLMSVAEGYGLKVVPVDAPWGQPLQAADFEAALAHHPDAKAIAAVHLETSTAIVNPVEAIGQVSRRHGTIFFVDAVSSLGGLEMRMDDWGIDLVASATQKCLGAPPGLSPVAVSKAGWEAIDRNPDKAHGWYSDLRVWRHYAVDWGDWHPFPVTMATNNVMALRASLDTLLAEGIQQRLKRYCDLALRLRAGLRRVGMPPFTPDELMAPVLTTAYGPAGVPTGEIVNYLAETHQIKIAGGLGALKDKVFRIGHMSPMVSPADIDEVIAALAEFNHKS
ncbi:MAG: alanine--glyoxylate aminotransferase family protein [Chloroflexi bacterium]|nr:alanine--glyoxylate aminotransferase family protein [Chloroflexota bacterium]